MDNKNSVVWMFEGIFLSVWGLMMVFIFRPKANPHVGGFLLGLLLRYVIAATIILIVVGVAAARWGRTMQKAPKATWRELEK